MDSRTSIGLVGYGSLGQFLAKAILNDPKINQKFKLGFVWNRTIDKIDSLIPTELILQNLDEFPSKPVDLIVEVSHPHIVATYGSQFLQHSDLFIGSPTALSDQKLETQLRDICQHNHGIYIPSGALWGAHDIQKMSNSGSLGSLTITMKKHPSSLKLEPSLMEVMNKYVSEEGLQGEFTVFEGSVRDLCPLAPNNVNTMATAALAAHNLGFDRTKARLVADKRLQAHVIEIEAEGPPKENFEDVFKVKTVRYNPAKPGAVTGNATYGSFLSSLLLSTGKGPGFHFC